VLAAYVYTASLIFLVGVQLDELLRKDASAGEQGILGLLLRGTRVWSRTKRDPPTPPNGAK
jgi:hypothetical protein